MRELTRHATAAADGNPYAALFEPVRIGSMDLPNRIVMPAMSVRFGGQDGSVSEQQIAYFLERVRGGAGLVILDNTAVDWPVGRGSGNPTRIDHDRFIVGLSDLVGAVHRAGGKIAAQPHHAGRQNTLGNIDGPAPVAPSAVACKVSRAVPHELTEPEIETVIGQFVAGVERAHRAGFDAAELHGAHGYLISNFVSPYTNRRTDGWGGDRERRFRFPLEIVRCAREAVGRHFTITYRMNAEDRVPGGFALDDAIALARELEAAGVDALNVSAGIYESSQWIFTMQGMGTGLLAGLGEAVRREVSIPVMQVGRLGHDPRLASDLVRERRIDLVVMGRSLLTDPALPRKLAEGRAGEIRPCIACNECVGFLRKGARVRCVVNPRLGREHELNLRPPRWRARLLVVGAGPAGMEAALTACSRGHRVTLVERAAQVGGLLRLAAVPGHKRIEFTKLLDFYESELRRNDVDVRCGCTVTADTAGIGGYDAVIVATGGTATTPALPGAGAARALAVTDLLAAGLEGLGPSAAVLGDRQDAFDAALWLAESGRTVTLVTQHPQALADVNPVLSRYLVERAADAGLEILTSSHAVDVSADAVVVRTPAGERRLEAATVAVAADLAPDGVLAATLVDVLPRVFAIGDAAAPGRLYQATQDALEAVLALDSGAQHRTADRPRGVR